ncbi:FecCD family ABC transporter permease [Subtercola frigoramans]|uniref:Iron complex transport system permease protein n=1 Tax=Subtercola frigoramans TaxID=120298 RepID=A0ABS2L5T5_9MICO|nr:iron ABC transporter permease [Subtercola frigoramans]MBM7472463.1 iron complex transport system permease protein [Subtercola frigoramans]
MPGVAELRRPTFVRLAWLGVGIIVLALLALVSLVFGTRIVSVDELVSALGGDTTGIAEAAIVKRVPRTVLALVVGAALAVSGATMQAVTRNPLADPGILGVSSGAALAVVTGIAFFGMSDPFVFIWMAIAGAAAAAVFVYTVGSAGRGGATPLKLALAGAAISATLGSLISAILLPRADILSTFRFWQIGGVGGATWERIGILVPFFACGLLVCLLSARGMNTLGLGDDLAAGLGESVFRTRLVSSAGAVILCGAATAIAGPIGFLGLVVPHFCRMLVGTDQRWLLPFSALAGAALLVMADVIGRVVARPQEIDVGIITAVIGAPFFIWIVRRQKVREL